MADTTILHLSDIHAGRDTFRDIDEKARIAGASVPTPLQLLSNYLKALPRKPDLVVVSGDITIRGDRAGMLEFRTWLMNEIAAGHLPRAERILIVPGNHDVTRRKREADDKKQQFQNFWDVFGRAFPHASVPTHDPLSPPLAGLPADTSLLGGIVTETAAGEVSLKSSLPYILDLQADVLIYGFNSAHGCGYPLPPDPQISRNLDSLIHLASADTAKTLTEVRDKYLDSLVVDAGMLTSDQIQAFTDHMLGLRALLGERFAKLTKIAVLHHHVGHMWQQQLEVKEFETVIEASAFKQALTEQAFDLVLHGHKHTNHVGIDGSLIPVDQAARFNPLCIVSGGTIGGHPRPNDRQSFKIVELPGPPRPRRAAVVREVPLLPVSLPGEVIARDARIYNVPLGDRIPSLHDLSPMKEALDQKLVATLAPELSGGTGLLASGARLSTEVDGLFAATYPYRSHAFTDGAKGRVFYEVLQATRALKFGTISRLQWLISAVARPREGEAAAKIIILIGNLEETHYSEATAPGDTAESIATLMTWLKPAIDAGVVEVRCHQFTQDDVATLTQVPKP